MKKSADTSPVTAYEVHSSFRQEMGPGFLLSEFITQDKIEACTNLLQEASDAFFTDALADLQQLEAIMAAPPVAGEHEQVNIYVHNIKALAKVLGFTLITEICVHCVSALNSDQLSDKKRRALLEKLVETLSLAFSQRIRDDGGEAGKAILLSLRKLG